MTDKLIGNSFNPSKLEKSINQPGSEGWELVEMINSDSADMPTNRSEIIMIFKRKYKDSFATFEE